MHSVCHLLRYSLFDQFSTQVKLFRNLKKIREVPVPYYFERKHILLKETYIRIAKLTISLNMNNAWVNFGRLRVLQLEENVSYSFKLRNKLLDGTTMSCHC